MKNLFKLAYNPFTRIAGWKAFFIGILIVCATAVVGWQSQTVSYGLEIKATAPTSLVNVFLVTGVGLLCYVAVFYLLGVIFARGTRFQDILGTVTLARYPYLLASLFGFLIKGDFDSLTMDAIMENPFGVLEMINWGSMAVMSLIFMFVSVWAVALLYNGFKVSTDLKGGKCTGLFILGLVLSEVIMLVILW